MPNGFVMEAMATVALHQPQCVGRPRSRRFFELRTP